MAQIRQNTKLESEGAEFLVLGKLLIEGVVCYKSYVNYPGFDLIAVNLKSDRSARIQVKSRWATDYNKSLPIKNFDCDFVVHVALNRGIRYRKRSHQGNGEVKAPEFFVFPVNVVRVAQDRRDKWGKVAITKIPNYSSYKDNWGLIVEFLRNQQTS